MSRGLGRFERWILTRTYLKTVLQKLPRDWKLPAGYTWAQEHYASRENRGGIPGLEAWGQNLSRAEILLNRFNLETSDRRKPHDIAAQCFKYTAAYRVALASLWRTLLCLYANHLIEWDSPFVSTRTWVQWDGIRLTPKGVAAAEELISVNGFDPFGADFRTVSEATSCKSTTCSP